MPINNFKQDETTSSVVKIKTVSRLLKYLYDYKKQVLLTLFLMIVIIGVTIINPLIMKIAIDDYVKIGDSASLVKLLIIALVLNFVMVFALRWRIRVMAKVTNHVLLTIRQTLYNHLQKLSFSFFDERPVGKLLARVIGDVNSLKELYHQSVVTLIPDFLTLLVALVLMLVINTKLALAALILLPLLILGVYIVEVRAHKRWQKFKNKQSNLNAFTHESISGIKVIKSFTAEEDAQNILRRITNDIKTSFTKAIRLNNFFWPMVEMSWGFGTIAVFVIGIYLVGRKQITPGTILAFSTYIAYFWRPIMNLSNFYNQLIANIAGAERIFEILDTKPDIIDKDNAKILPEIKGDVEFKDVLFSYDNENIVLDNISFNVEKGETIALVGPTGAGKTTLTNVITRFYDIQSGKILIDGNDIMDVTLDSLRKQMGIMTQDTFLFSGTIMDNIRYGKLDASDEEVIQAAKTVMAHNFIINFEDGYNTKINEKGARLSTGQKQLIAFARTILSNPRILILDEATSSIDTKTERLIQKGIDKILEGRTSFVVAHRLSTIKKADRIFVIDDGIIKESGNHDELMEAKGIYYSMYMSQKQSLSY